jgi:hypothetical protein
MTESEVCGGADHGIVMHLPERWSCASRWQLLFPTTCRSALASPT